MKSGKGEKRQALVPEEELQKLGNRIKQLLIAKGYKNYEIFAYEHGINRAQYGQYENGKNLRYASLIKILNAFEMSIEEFFSEGFGKI